jgi:hypothetical protein
MLTNFLKQIFNYISSNLLFILNICYYIKKFNFELFNDSSSKDLVRISINLNITDLVIITMLILMFNLMPILKRFILSNNHHQTSSSIINNNLENYLNQGQFKVKKIDSRSILIENTNRI